MALWAGAIAAIIGTAVSTYSAVSSAQAQAEQSRQQARTAKQQAEYAKQQAEADAQTKQRQFDRVLAAQRARFGASGVLPEGTPLLVEMQSQEEAALDVLRVRHGGLVASQGLRAEAAQFRRAGRLQERQGYLSGTASLLQGVSQGASIYGRRSSSAPPAGTGSVSNPYRSFYGD